MDSISIRQLVTYCAKVTSPRLTQGQVDYYYQYSWKALTSKTIQELVDEIKSIQDAVDREGEVRWAEGLNKRDPLRVGEIPLGNKARMDWEW